MQASMNREEVPSSSRQPYEKKTPVSPTRDTDLSRVDIKSFISILKFDAHKRACACRHAAGGSVVGGEGEFLVSQGGARR